jgi:hypothetical protein
MAETLAQSNVTDPYFQKNAISPPATEFGRLVQQKARFLLVMKNFSSTEQTALLPS